MNFLPSPSALSSEPAPPIERPDEVPHVFWGDNMSISDWQALHSVSGLALSPPSLPQDSLNQVSWDGSGFSQVIGESQVIPTSSMGLPPRGRKRKAPTLNANAWEPYKAQIIELHIEQKLSLTEVKLKMEEQFGFSAEIRQYRTRITQWGKDKNIKPAEMKSIVRKRQQRRLAETDKRELSFTVRGTEVPQRKIDRWMSTNEVPPDHLYAPSPAAPTPSDVHCETISQRDSATPIPTYSSQSPKLFQEDNMTLGTASPAMEWPGYSLLEVPPPLQSLFAGQSPTPINQTSATRFPTSPHCQTVARHDNVHFTMDSISCPLGHSDKQHLQENSLMADISSEPSLSKTLEILFDSVQSLVLGQRRPDCAKPMMQKLKAACQIANEMDGGYANLASELFNPVLIGGGLGDRADSIVMLLYLDGLLSLTGEHPSTLNRLHYLARTHVLQAQNVKGVDPGINLLEEGKRIKSLAVEKRSQIGGQSGMLRMMSRIALQFVLQGRYEEAEELERKVLDARRRTQGKEHSAALCSMSLLAWSYIQQGRYQEAQELETKVLDVRKRRQGEEKSGTLYCMSRLAWMHILQGQYQEARELETKVLDMRKKRQGEKHSATLDTVRRLAWLSAQQGAVEMEES